MRIFDMNNNELTIPDLSLGFLQKESLFVKHHEAIPATEEQGHWEVTKEYPNGGKDVHWVIDIPGIEAMEAWDEYEEIYRYIQFTTEELDAINAENNRTLIMQRVSDLEEALNMMLNEVME